jgi:NADPH-dependent 2,4-dienoyl-CoA reductase/sulfur reductase-like enzyme
VVIGAGPAGVGAALAAAETGARTLIVDEGLTSGGQVYRAVPAEFQLKRNASPGPDYAIGEALRKRLLASPVQTAFGRRVWNVSSDLRVDAVGPAGIESWRPRALIVATGATERVVPFPGWTLPGVIGLAAATILLKSQQVLPGERTMVAGCGPLLAAVAVAIIKGGGKVAAVIDLSGPVDWLAALPRMTSRPDLLGRGLGWLKTIRGAGVPILFRHMVKEVRQSNGLLEVVAWPVDRERRPRPAGRGSTFQADCVTVGHGLVPATEVTRLLRADHEFRAEDGGWIAVRDADFRSSLERVYVAGDGAGISGASAAFLQGSIAGFTAGLDLGKLDRDAHARATALIRKRARKAERFGRAMGGMMTLRPAQLEGMTPDTIVCRCEDVTRGEIEAAIANGAREVNQLKAWTRCGMGPCQGRICGEVAATLIASRVGGREAAGIWTARAPLRPLSLATMTGDYEYRDIPIPTAAPL